MAATNNDKQYYEIYRRASLGNALADELDNFITAGRFDPQLAIKFLNIFDKVVTEVFAEKVKSRMSFKGHLDTYRFCDDVWTFIIKDVTFKLDNSASIQADRIKIVAMNNKKPGET
ncbi:transcription initiation factor IIA, gamma subunit [Aulographum hederae CBS 113979]|uniref:Transcription initiation factor IIA subunit 2 n=1 Tax=Aulographum hederae CBS 113979 TaxID=1176131 RepID=A0A6G1GN92_9PEZI|nr:transcription initiation factor IIA, gamma subunit [Aulographum hederae CBS 113979]